MESPSRNELEINLFGNGFGEGLLIHIANNDWIAIDSLCDSSNKPWALQYLQEKGISPNCIKYVVATHWDTDHIKGLSQIYKAAVNSHFVFSKAIQDINFWERLLLSDSSNIEKRKSSIAEFTEIINEYALRTKNNSAFKEIILASESLLIHDDELIIDGNPIHRQIRALSPSTAAQIKSLKILASMNSNIEPIKNVRTMRPNHTSIVLLIKVGDICILLGSDLEELGEDNDGWKAILNNRNQLSKSEVFKIPHHGSETAHNHGVWIQLISNNVLSILTPFCHGKTNIPKEENIKRILSYSGKLYIAGGNRPTKPTRDILKLQRKVGKESTSIKREFGHLLLKKPVLAGQSWKIEKKGCVHVFPLDT